MISVLTTELREQAGADTYNRFEYQVHWIVCHIISQLQEDRECVVFCEFRDDMAEFSPDSKHYHLMSGGFTMFLLIFRLSRIKQCIGE